MQYTVTIEAQGYGDAGADGERLLDNLPDESDELRTHVGVDDDRGLVKLTLMFDAQDGMDAHEQGLGMWTEAWGEAFPDMANPMIFRIAARPGLPDAEIEAGMAAVAAGRADVLDDLDDDVEDE